MKTLTSDVSASLFYRVRFQDGGATLTLDNRRWSKDCRLKSIAHARSVYDIVLSVYDRFYVDGSKRYVNDDRFRVDGDKNIRLLAFTFTIVFVWTGPERTPTGCR